MRSEGYGTWFISVSVSLSVTTLSATTRNETKNSDTKGSALHWFDFQFGEFCKSATFERYGVKT